MKTEYWKDKYASEDLIDAFSLIDAIDFKYKDNAEGYGIDDDEHVGVKAQDLVDNPATPNVVKEDENGYLAVDTNELTTANTATLSEVCKRLLELEKRMEKLENETRE